MDNIQDPAAAPEGQAQLTGEQISVVSEEGKAPEGTTFKEIAEKKGFKTPDDLAKAYSHLEAKATESNMTVAELKKLFFEQQPQPNLQNQQVPQNQQQFTSEDIAALDKFVRERITSEKEILRNEFRTEFAVRELNLIMKEHPDFGKYATEVKEMKNRYPNMPFEEAYTFAKAMRGDLSREAKLEGTRQGAEYLRKQGEAQVLAAKGVSEKKVAVDDVLSNTPRKWRTDNKGNMSPQTVAEQKLVERELFGQELEEMPRRY